MKMSFLPVKMQQKVVHILVIKFKIKKILANAKYQQNINWKWA